ncbi:DUF1566 domain-containing protein [Candidatus Electronema sp. PJ]|uniref:Lcl C-terminal domain-containing protein n=1 Tax=Candidatus Electronema sp. PJ TaxID=3401572 RepID=UPI003AA9883C
MQKTSRISTVLILLLPFWATSAASSDWITPLKELIARKTTSSIESNGAEAKADDKQLPVRFKDNGDGTLTDSRTGLIWLKNANCSTFFEGDRSGNRNSRSWPDASVAVSKLANGFCGLKDSSKEGDWRLPTREELLAIAKESSQKEPCQAGQAFTGMQSFYYWSSTEGDLYEDYAIYVSILTGVDSYAFQLNSFHVLPVRGKKKP